ncbi:hypothetical protein P4O66_017036 [Electrophorus voltai]|uniref:Uncharacterized protein n=1 Tax=Electrophorus voltai TaxID=2609070 RepID=A0AAD9DNB4_9TELE|nr:hypothetical protein P4O66_017036 [Electrophorus voltai]
MTAQPLPAPPSLSSLLTTPSSRA